ncbi:methyltransferase [Thelonectria olida]|uniref:Methyltransferase n=1 Tax=Thelonectria olida TaxID=1576542 RepID=A0A9P8VWD9_9HYPO|nr:methyltransferase [Thelonectria olida]
MTTGVFRYLDPATLSINSEDGSRVKPWAKVDTDVTSFSRKGVERNVANIRESQSNFGIDSSGFAVYRAPASVDTNLLLQDDAVVRGAYYDSVETILRAQLPGVRKVVIFDHTIRVHKPDAARQPVQQVHVDQTPKAAEVRVRRHVSDPDEAEKLLAGRYQLVNVWRPIGHAASDFPLAVVDWRTTDPEDLIAVDLLYPKRDANYDGDDRGKEIRPDPNAAMSTEGYEVKGETYSVAPNEKHQFYYCKDMQPDEVMFIKCYDSRSEGQPGGKKGVAALTPHTAFIDPGSAKGAKPRQSIEVRCLIFYD